MPAYFYHLSLEVLRSSSSLALDSAWEALLPFQKRIRPLTSSATSSGGDSLAQFTQPYTNTPGKELTLERRFKHASASASASASSDSSSKHSPSSSLHVYPSTSSSSSDFQNDIRAGEILIECIDMMAPDEGAGKRTQRRSITPLSTAGKDNLVAAGIGTDILGGLRTKGRYIPLDQEVGDSVWGIVHLYRDVQDTPYLGGNDDDYPTYLKGSAAAARHPSEQQLGGASRAQAQAHGREKGSTDFGAYPFPATVSEDDCSTLCILAVPSYLSPPDFLGFVGEKTMEDVSHFRMIRTQRANRYMVLMKFRNGGKAKTWQKEWNGKVFNSMEVCLAIDRFLMGLKLGPVTNTAPPIARNLPCGFCEISRDPGCRTRSAINILICRSWRPFAFS